jgi:phosphoribosyl-dephospho-CoA transferase
MAALRRHQLAWLSATGWERVLRMRFDEAVAPVLQAWAARRLPLVVARQHRTAEGCVTLGWPAPRAAGRQRVALEVPLACVSWFDEFPYASEALAMLPRGARRAVQSLLADLRGQGARPRVYGSYGWQLLSGLAYVHDASDLDWWIAVRNREHADEVAASLEGFGWKGLRLDGELMFGDGTAVSWREYAAWRAGRTRGLLVKRLTDVEVVEALELAPWCEGAAA